jgi:hypothetical protein
MFIGIASLDYPQYWLGMPWILIELCLGCLQAGSDTKFALKLRPEPRAWVNLSVECFPSKFEKITPHYRGSDIKRIKFKNLLGSRYEAK